MLISKNKNSKASSLYNADNFSAYLDSVKELLHELGASGGIGGMFNFLRLSNAVKHLAGPKTVEHYLGKRAQRVKRADLATVYTGNIMQCVGETLRVVKNFDYAVKNQEIPSYRDLLTNVPDFQVDENLDNLSDDECRRLCLFGSANPRKDQFGSCLVAAGKLGDHDLIKRLRRIQEMNDKQVVADQKRANKKVAPVRTITAPSPKSAQDRFKESVQIRLDNVLSECEQLSLQCDDKRQIRRDQLESLRKEGEELSKLRKNSIGKSYRCISDTIHSVTFPMNAAFLNAVKAVQFEAVEPKDILKNLGDSPDTESLDLAAQLAEAQNNLLDVRLDLAVLDGQIESGQRLYNHIARQQDYIMQAG